MFIGTAIVVAVDKVLSAASLLSHSFIVADLGARRRMKRAFNCVSDVFGAAEKPPYRTGDMARKFRSISSTKQGADGLILPLSPGFLFLRVLIRQRRLYLPIRNSFDS